MHLESASLLGDDHDLDTRTIPSRKHFRRLRLAFSPHPNESARLAAARAKHPHRFHTTNDAEILALPGPAWINKPDENTEETAVLTAA